jgi:hypothetical protein
MVFRQSTKDCIISVVMQIEGCEWLQAVEFVVRCDTLPAYVDTAARVVVVPTAGVAVDAGSSIGDGDSRSASAQAQVVVGDGDVNAVRDVPCAAWGPQATTLSNQMHVGWRYLCDEGCPGAGGRPGSNRHAPVNCPMAVQRKRHQDA